MLTRIPIMLDERDIHALSRLAKHEYRDIRQQAAILIRQELERRGLLAATNQPAQDETAEVQNAADQPTK